MDDRDGHAQNQNPGVPEKKGWRPAHWRRIGGCCRYSIHSKHRSPVASAATAGRFQYLRPMPGEAFAPHGYFGVETQVGDTIARFINASTAHQP
jgi:hypothetical protein